MATIPEALSVALEHHRAGRLQAAEQIYQQVLAVEPDHPDALHLLGVIAHQSGRHEIAVQHIARAIRMNEAAAAFHNNLGKALKALGRAVEAMACYHRALELRPDYAEANINLGAALHNEGQVEEAITCYQRALQLQPDCAEAHYNLGVALNDQGQESEAIACHQRALKLKPDYAEAHNNLGTALRSKGRLAEAIACHQRALQLKPDYAEAHNNLGNALFQQKQITEAIASYERAVRLNPDYAEAHNNLGIALKDQCQIGEAVICYQRALGLKPDYAEVHNNLGVALQDKGQISEAIACYERALELKPDYAEVHNNLGVALQDKSQISEAIACYERALKLKPEYAEVYNNLGSALRDQGRIADAVVCYQRALELMPSYLAAYDNLVYTLNFHAGYDAEAIYEEHIRWNQQFGEPLAKLMQPHTNERTPDRRLRVGYVSPDFRQHVVGRNLLPLFREHDHQTFEIFGYSNALRCDRLTDRFQSYADVWRDVERLSDEDLAQQIRDDRIDILVDLTLHMARNRLLVFARKPAPVQVTFAGYPGTTGLTQIDYRLTDVYLDPPGLYDRYYSEESIRLADSFWCYDPLCDEPPVNELPAFEKGYVTFGCLNNFAKTNIEVLKLWAEVMKAVEHSRLMILAGHGSHRQQTLDFLAEEGIAAERVTFVGNQPHQRYLELYHQLDMGLDTFPYNGHTTSLDSLWMGVPVVTMVGQTVVGRAGLSQLSNLGLKEWIAFTPEDFVRIAVDFARDWPHLNQLRSTLRVKMQNSPLMNAVRFTRCIEAAYCKMWQRYCAR